MDKQKQTPRRRARAPKQPPAGNAQTKPALDEGEQRFRQLSDAAFEGIAIHDQGIILEVNQAFCEMFRCDRSWAIGRSVLELTAPEWRDLVRQKIAQGDPQSYEGVAQRRDGATFIAELVGKPIRYDGRTVRVTAIHDITERRRAENALRDSELRYRRLFEATQDGILLLDAKTGAITDVNPFLTEMLGYPCEEMIGKKLWETPAFRNIDASQHPFLELQAKEYVRYDDLPLQTRDGRLVQVEFVSNVYAIGNAKVIQCNIRDITHRKQAEDALRENELRYRTLFEESPISLWEEDYSALKTFLDELKNVGVDDLRVYFHVHPEELARCFSLIKIVDINQATLKLFHAKSKEELLGNLSRIVPPEAYSAEIEQFAALAEGKTYFEIEIVNQTLTGDKIDVALRWYVAPEFQSTWARTLVSLIDLTERKRAEDGRLQAEKKYHDIVEYAVEGVFQSSPDGRYLSVNPAMAQMYGYASPEEMIVSVGNNIATQVYADPRRRAEFIRILSEEGAVKEFQAPNRRKDGSVIWTSTTAHSVRDASGAVLYYEGSSIDITERKRAEDQLRIMSLSVEQSPASIVITDIAGNIEYVNPKFTQITGYSLEEAVGKNPRILQSGETPREMYQQLWDIILTGGVWRGEFHNRKKNGELYWESAVISPVMDKEGFISHLLAVKEDITERKRAEEARLQAEKKYRDIVENAVEGIYQSTPDGRFLSVNAAMARLYGYASPEEMIASVGNNIATQVYADPNRRAEFTRIIETDGTISGFEAQAHRKDGVPIWVSVNGRVVRDAGGAPLYYECTLIDITERKRAEEQARRREEQIAALNAAAIEIQQHHDPEKIYQTASDELRKLGTFAHVFRVTDEQFLQHIHTSMSQETLAEFVQQFGDQQIGASLPPEVLSSLQNEVDAGAALVDSDSTRRAISALPPDIRPMGNWMFDKSRQSALLIAPIRRADALVAVIVVEGGSLSASDIPVVTLFAQQVSIALENAYLLAETERRANEMAALYANTRDLSIQWDLDQLLETISERAAHLLRASGSGIYLYDAARQDLSAAMATGNVAIIGTRLRLGEGLAGRVAQSRQPMMVDNYRTWDERSPQYDHMKFGAVLETPMLYGGELIGVLAVHELGQARRRFTESDARLLSLFASQAASAVHSARQFSTITQRLAELEAVNRVSTALRAAETVGEMLPIILDETLAVLGTNAGAIRLAENSSRSLYTQAARGFFSQLSNIPVREGEGIAGHVLATGQVYVSREFASDPRTLEATRAQYPSGWSGACIPLRTAQQAIGVLYVSVPLPRELTPGEIHLLTTLAEIAGNAIHRSRLFDQTKTRLERIAALRAIDEAIGSSLDLRITLNILLNQVVAHLRVDATAVFLLDPHAQSLRFAAGRGFRSRIIEHATVHLGAEYAGRAALERRTIFVADLTKQDNALTQLLQKADEPFVSYCGVPLIVKGQVRGVLEVFHRSELTPEPEWLEFLETLAAQTAIAIDNIELFEKAQRSIFELGAAYEATIEGWSYALYLRDQETEGHTQRVTELTLRVAAAIGMSTDQLVHFRRGALLHDIGKMGIPDSILLKPGPLTEAEWDIMRRHPVYAYELLSPIDYLHPAMDIPYCHHERWDGSGYPRGLKGEQIPLAARIFAIGDVWDALCSDRPYRAAWSVEKTREYIQANAGILFDPDIVSIFLKLANADQPTAGHSGA